MSELGASIKRVQAHYQLTVLLVEHHMQLVMSISDHVVVLSDALWRRRFGATTGMRLVW